MPCIFTLQHVYTTACVHHSLGATDRLCTPQPVHITARRPQTIVIAHLSESTSQLKRLILADGYAHHSLSTSQFQRAPDRLCAPQPVHITACAHHCLGASNQQHTSKRVHITVYRPQMGDTHHSVCTSLSIGLKSATHITACAHHCLSASNGRHTSQR
eukprot:1153203-Pelagomonas_calceolata.AAC.1